MAAGGGGEGTKYGALMGNPACNHLTWDPLNHPSRGAMGDLLAFHMPTPPPATRKAMLARRRRGLAHAAEVRVPPPHFRPEMPRYEARPTTRPDRFTNSVERSVAVSIAEAAPPARWAPGAAAAAAASGGATARAGGGGDLPSVPNIATPSSARQVVRRAVVDDAWQIQTKVGSDGPPPITADRTYRVLPRDRWQDHLIRRAKEQNPLGCAGQDEIDSRRAMYSSFSVDGVYSPQTAKCNRRFYSVVDARHNVHNSVDFRPKWKPPTATPRRSPREPLHSTGAPPRPLRPEERVVGTPRRPPGTAPALPASTTRRVGRARWADSRDATPHSAAAATPAAAAEDDAAAAAAQSPPPASDGGAAEGAGRDARDERRREEEARRRNEAAAKAAEQGEEEDEARRAGARRRAEDSERKKAEAKQRGGPSAQPKAGAEGLQDVLIRKHNELRARHGAGPLSFSDACRVNAQKQAEVCAAEARMFHGNIGEGEGQNCYMSMATPGTGEGDAAAAVAASQGWYDEIKDYEPGAGFSMETGHFTQLVWKGSTHCGTGIARCSSGGWDHVYLVTNYSPPGNWAGQFPENVQMPPAS